jgi:hypothetical protein
MQMTYCDKPQLTVLSSGLWVKTCRLIEVTRLKYGSNLEFC